MVKSKSSRCTTTSSQIPNTILRAPQDPRTTTYEACKGWERINNLIGTFASSRSLLSSLSRLLHGRLVSSSSLRHSSMEVEQGLFGAPYGVGLVSHQSTLAWYVCWLPDHIQHKEHLCYTWRKLQLHIEHKLMIILLQAEMASMAPIAGAQYRESCPKPAVP
jgi:hypothetical protein